MDKSINTPDIDAYCLVRVDGQFNRGKIFEVDFNESVWLKVFLVDTGLIVNAEYCDVFDIPDSLIEFMPFQVNKIAKTVFAVQKQNPENENE